jgi:MFS family permease
MKGTLERVREALSAHDFRFLFSARLLNQLADGLFQITILDQVVFDPVGQDTAIGFAKAAALFAVPYSLVGPFVGVFIDRWPRRRILQVAPLVRASAAVLTLWGLDAPVPFYVGALVVISVNRFFLSTANAVMPRVVPSEDLLIGNSMATVGGTFAYALGASLGGFASSAWGAGPVVAVVVVMWLVTALLARRIRASLVAEGRPTTPLRHDLVRVGREALDGVRVLRRTPRASIPILSITLDQFVQGMLLLIATVVFKDRFGEDVDAFSKMVAAGAVGTLLGIVTIGPMEPRLSKPRMVAVAFLVSGATLLAVAGWMTLVMVLVAGFMTGLTFAYKKIPIDTMVQEAIPDAYRGRVFAVYDFGYNMSRIVAALVAVVLLPVIGEEWVIAIGGALFLLWVPVVPRAMRRHPETASAQGEGPGAQDVE